MLLNSPALFMEMFNILIENMALFKYVQDCLARSKIEKKVNEFLVVENLTIFSNNFHDRQKVLEEPSI